jgi:hypothetical protein
VYKQKSVTDLTGTAKNDKQLFLFATQTGWFVTDSLDTEIQKAQCRVVSRSVTHVFGYLQYTSNSGLTVHDDCTSYPLRFHWPQWTKNSRDEITIDVLHGNKLAEAEEEDEEAAPTEVAQCDDAFPVIGGRLAEQYLNV